MSTDHNFWRGRRAEAISNRGPSAYQPNALPLGQTGWNLLAAVFTLSSHGVSQPHTERICSLTLPKRDGANKALRVELSLSSQSKQSATDITGFAGYVDQLSELSEISLFTHTSELWNLSFHTHVWALKSLFSHTRLSSEISLFTHTHTSELWNLSFHTHVCALKSPCFHSWL